MMALSPGVVCTGFAPSPSPIERYYQQRYLLRDGADRRVEDTYVHFHLNGFAP